MADYATKYTEKQMQELKKRIKEVFGEAAKDVKKQMDEFYAKSKMRDQKMQADLKAGKITKQKYQDWLKGQVFQGEWWERRLHDITAVYVDADKKSRDIVSGVQKNVFMEAANYSAYDIDQNTRGAVAFNIYDEKTVERLLKDNPKMLPEWRIDEPKDYIWNEHRVQNEVTRGIIQGDAIPDIAKRLSTELSTGNEKKMNLFARTAMTGAQNAGRIQRLHESSEMGIDVKKKWLATLDKRTRDEHGELDGQERDVDEKFVVNGKEIDYPGDPLCPHPELVYNCRCTLTYVYPKYQHLQKNVQRYDQEAGKVVEEMTYKQWKESKKQNNLLHEEKEKNNYGVKRIEYSDLFPAEAIEITRQTIQQLQTEFPLAFDFDYVGDVRIHRNIGLDDDVFDLHYNHKELTPCAAQYLWKGTNIADGKPCIEIHKEDLSTRSLRDEFQARVDLRNRQGISMRDIPTKEHAFFTVSDSLEGTIMHEYGHALSDSFGVFSSGRENSYKDWEWKFWEQHKEELSAMSLYATSHPDEMFAEAFVQYHDKEHTDTLAYKLASEIIETFIKYTKGGEI